ncbi:MAG TPA: hypothetical protein VHX60_06965 [Acidobacteriaceae bacterium]|jgi:hypothetical protein|nr:hypothetical protein [Acidobacteriaceae bacterium]
MWFLVILTLTVAAAGWFLWHQLRARRLRSADWATLAAALQPVPIRGLELVARDFLEPGGGRFWERSGQTRIEPSEIYELLGQSEGLSHMRHNAEIMVRLAAYVQVWDHTESVVVAHRMRHDAILLKRALFRLRLAGFIGARAFDVPFYTQQAASQYYLMRQRLLALYETSQFVLYPQLQAALETL